VEHFTDLCAQQCSLVKTLNEQCKVAEAQNIRINKLYSALSLCNQAIVRCTSIEDLFYQICYDAVTYGDMNFAWVGVVEGTDVIPKGAFGHGSSYLNNIKVSTDKNHPFGNGPAGIAIRTSEPIWCQDFLNDIRTQAWHDRAIIQGWKSSCAIPFHQDSNVIGALMLYSDKLNAFDEPIRNLLQEMVIDIDHAIKNFEREKILRQSESILHTIIYTAPIRIFWKDINSRYLGCNLLFAKDAGKSHPNELTGENDIALFSHSEQYRIDDIQVMSSRTPKLFYEEELITPDGEQRCIRTSKVPLIDSSDEVIGVLGVYEDITDIKKREAEIIRLANFDVLTGLHNRNMLETNLNKAINEAKRSTDTLALMFLDLDHFKDVNDTLGHSAGDELLVEVAKRLKKLLREEDSITRHGGDEFIFILPGTNRSGAIIVAHKILSTIARPIKICNQELHISGTLGIAFYPQDGSDLETLSKNADTAMYKAKREGKNKFCFFTPELHQNVLRHVIVSNFLRSALQMNQLQVCFQPQVNSAKRIIGAETLLRWDSPVLGLVPPQEFIPVAEESGLIFEIGEWVLREAIRFALKVQQTHPRFIIAVNLSASQFNSPTLVSNITSILNEENFNPLLLELELTESVAMKNPTEGIDVMNKLADLGIRLSIDDFGTGYSSLSYLKKFKLCKLKIDKSFVDECCSDGDDATIVCAVINLAHSLGLKIIAEGVEFENQFNFLKENGCLEYQGYLFGKPMTEEEFLQLL
jgi:diguanylate cyclase (GGDEF)-like protein/PAS domain S-box-containing protein